MKKVKKEINLILQEITSENLSPLFRRSDIEYTYKFTGAKLFNT